MREPDGKGSPASPYAVRARVRMEAEFAATPADEQPDREIGDHKTDRRLRRLLDPLWQKAVKEDDGKPKADQRRRVADAPGKPELPGPGPSRGGARAGSRPQARSRATRRRKPL